MNRSPILEEQAAHAAVTKRIGSHMHPNDAKAQAFKALHTPGNPLILYNAWDAGSARTVAEAGASAIATGSWSVAASHGVEDGEKVLLDDVVANLARIVRSTDLPVSIDLESGYGESFRDLGLTITRAIHAGAVGCNLEDSIPGSATLRDAHEQADRIGWARRAANAASISFFINARTDVFLQAPPETHDRAMVDEVLMRARIYAASSADGLFVPGLIDVDLIRELTSSSPLPVNVMVVEGSPDLPRLIEARVARVSHGPGPYLHAMRAVMEGASAAFAV